MGKGGFPGCPRTHVALPRIIDHIIMRRNYVLCERSSEESTVKSAECPKRTGHLEAVPLIALLPAVRWERSGHSSPEGRLVCEAVPRGVLGRYRAGTCMRARDQKRVG